MKVRILKPRLMRANYTPRAAERFFIRACSPLDKPFQDSFGVQCNSGSTPTCGTHCFEVNVVYAATGAGDLL
jgi:hypothetical protein